jgi:hypothetical protein
LEAFLFQVGGDCDLAVEFHTILEDHPLEVLVLRLVVGRNDEPEDVGGLALGFIPHDVFDVSHRHLAVGEVDSVY